MSGHSNVSVKQPALVPGDKQAYSPDTRSVLPVYMDYESIMLSTDFPAMLPTKYDGEFSQPMSMKYAELYSVPKSFKYPDLYSGPGQYYDEAFFPVDTPNIIPNPSPATDFKQRSHLERKPQESNSKYGGHSEMDYLFSDTDDLDLCSLLAIPAPANKDTEVSDPFNLWGFQPSLEGLDFLDPALLKSAIPDGIHYWNGFEKEGSNDVSKPAVTDPVISSYGLAAPENKCEDDTTLVSATAESTLHFEDPHTMSPASSDQLSLTSEDCPMPSASPTSSENWGKGLKDLFERTFDMSDIGDYMLPPPNKRQESPNSQYWAVEQKPQLSSPPSPMNTSPSPDAKMMVGSPPSSLIESSPPSQDEGILKHREKNKPKPTLLFGKHEGEIIRKLLVNNNRVKSKPITRDKLITIPVEEFNQMLEEAELSEIEVAFMKEWRRRGKNKAAAQVARKRKREEVSGLDEQVEKMRQQKADLEKRQDRLQSLVKSLKERSRVAEDKLFQKQSEHLKEPVSRDTHHIHVTDDDKLLLIPRISSKILVVNS